MSILRGKKSRIVKEFAELKEKEKLLKQQIELLRNQIDADIDFGVHKCGDVELNIIEKERTSLDKNKVKKILGDKIKKCYTKSTYTVISVKRVA